MKKALLLVIAALCAITLRADADFPQLTDVPTLYIDAQDHAPITSKETYVPAVIRWVDAEGVTTYDDGSIRGRGNGTWVWDKKAYRIKFDKKKKFLGEGRANAKSWTLLANFADKTLIRNGVASEIGTLCGQPFTAAAEFVDLVLNGEYLGNYQVSDQVNINKKRINIPEQEEPATESSDITGGYLLEVDGYYWDNKYWFETSRAVKISIKSPDDEVINKAQRDYIRKHIQKFEDALFSDDFRDPERGYRQYVDSTTLASWYIASEYTGNPDCFWSTYIYKRPQNDKIYWGPLWDFDIAFNNCMRIGDVTSLLMADRAFGHDLTRQWVLRMWQDPWFVQLINREWQRVVNEGLEDKVIDYVERTAAHIDQSQALNFCKWPINRRDHDEITLYDTYREGIDYLEAYLHAHIDYLSIRFAQEAGELPLNPYNGPEFDYDPRYFYTITNVKVNRNVTHDAQGYLCIARPNADDDAQLWDLRHLCGNRYVLINLKSGRSILDPSVKEGSLFTGGVNLTTSELPDPRNEREIWAIHPEGTDGACYFRNIRTYLAWSNSGGKNDDGNRITAWVSELEQNKDHPNRMFTLTPARLKPEAEQPENGIFQTSAPQYSVSYSAASATIRFNGIGLAGTWAVFTPSGAKVLAGNIAPEVSVASLAAGVYILRWTDSTLIPRTVKFLIQ